jgi:hypothetical protein
VGQALWGLRAVHCEYFWGMQNAEIPFAYGAKPAKPPWPLPAGAARRIPWHGTLHFVSNALTPVVQVASSVRLDLASTTAPYLAAQRSRG